MDACLLSKSDKPRNRQKSPANKLAAKDVRNPRDGKTVYVGSSWKDVEYTSDGESKTICMRIVYEVIERTKNGKSSAAGFAKSLTTL